MAISIVAITTPKINASLMSRFSVSSFGGRTGRSRRGWDPASAI